MLWRRHHDVVVEAPYLLNFLHGFGRNMQFHLPSQNVGMIGFGVDDGGDLPPGPSVIFRNRVPSPHHLPVEQASLGLPGVSGGSARSHQFPNMGRVEEILIGELLEVPLRDISGLHPFVRNHIKTVSKQIIHYK